MEVNINHINKFCNRKWVANAIQIEELKRNEDFVDYALHKVGYHMTVFLNSSKDFESEKHLVNYLYNMINKWMPSNYFIRKGEYISYEEGKDFRVSDLTIDYEEMVDNLWWDMVEKNGKERYAMALDWIIGFDKENKPPDHVVMKAKMVSKILLLS